MFIQTEVTPNPATLKFLPGRTVMDEGTFEARDAAQAERSPLAKALHGAAGGEQRFLRQRLHLRDQGRGRMAAPAAGRAWRRDRILSLRRAFDRDWRRRRRHDR